MWDYWLKLVLWAFWVIRWRGFFKFSRRLVNLGAYRCAYLTMMRFEKMDDVDDDGLRQFRYLMNKRRAGIDDLKLDKCFGYLLIDELPTIVYCFSDNVGFLIKTVGQTHRLFPRLLLWHVDVRFCGNLVSYRLSEQLLSWLQRGSGESSGTSHMVADDELLGPGGTLHYWILLRRTSPVMGSWSLWNHFRKWVDFFLKFEIKNSIFCSPAGNLVDVLRLEFGPFPPTNILQ